MQKVPYSRNRDETPQGSTYRCLLCGRNLGIDPPRWWVTLIAGGQMAEPTDEVDSNDSGYIGPYPVGPECRRKVGNCAWQNPGQPA